MFHSKNSSTVSFNFRVIDTHSGQAGGEIDIDVNDTGEIESVFLDGEDFTDQEGVLEAIKTLIGPKLIENLLTGEAG